MIKVHKPSIVRKIWGGKKLDRWKQFNIVESNLPVGETLEINDADLPYLAKLIDTSDELSIQVHPADDYASLHENSSGKTECWVILEAFDEAGIYLGLKDQVTRSEIENYLAEKKPINHLLNFYQVKAGDFFFVPAGSIHAIGRNITLAEVQQNSGITYRVWDWNRLDERGQPRELHIKKSLDVINFETQKNQLDFFQHKKNIFQKPGLHELCEHKDFHLFLLNQKMNERYFSSIDLKRPCSILNLTGKILLNGIPLEAFQAATLDQERTLSIEALEEGSSLLIF